MKNTKIIDSDDQTKGILRMVLCFASGSTNSLYYKNAFELIEKALEENEHLIVEEIFNEWVKDYPKEHKKHLLNAFLELSESKIKFGHTILNLMIKSGFKPNLFQRIKLKKISTRLSKIEIEIKARIIDTQNLS